MVASLADSIMMTKKEEEEFGYIYIINVCMSIIN